MLRTHLLFQYRNLFHFLRNFDTGPGETLDHCRISKLVWQKRVIIFLSLRKRFNEFSMLMRSEAMLKSIFNVFLAKSALHGTCPGFYCSGIASTRNLKYDDSEKRNNIFLPFSFHKLNVWMQIADVPHLVTSSVDNGAVWSMNVR